MEDCLFCKIIKKEEHAHFVYEDEEFVVIKNKYPVAPVHLLIIPKKHIEKADSLYGESKDIWPHFFETAQKVVDQEGLWPSYQLLINAPGVAHFNHEHMHIISGLDEPLG